MDVGGFHDLEFALSGVPGPLHGTVYREEER